MAKNRLLLTVAALVVLLGFVVYVYPTRYFYWNDPTGYHRRMR
jgi:hypothetical protein